MLNEVGVTAVNIQGSLQALSMNGKFIRKGHIATYPFRIPMSLSSRSPSSVREVSEISVGAPGAGDDVEIGSMISKAHYERVLAALEDIRKEGHTIAVGGNALEGPGYFIEPTVVTDVAAGAPITSNEIFGPVVSVEIFSTDEEAITRANETVYGLAASVWTTNSSRSLSVPRRLDFGTVWVNSHLVIANEMPWGGFKGSGYGRDLSIYALEDFSRTKHVMYNRG